MPLAASRRAFASTFGVWVRSSIGRRMALYILLFSSVVTLVSTVLQLALEFQRDVDDIRTELGQIRASYSDSLAASLWATSQKDLELQLGGILRLPDMQYIEVRAEQDQVIAQAGVPREARVIRQSFDLNYQHRGRQVYIGKVNLVATLDGAYRRLQEKVVVILITQTIKTFLVSLFILYLFQWLVGRHLSRIASFSEAISADQAPAELVLDRSPKATPAGAESGGHIDELALMVGALNGMQRRLRHSLSEVQALLAETERARQALHEANEHMEDQVRQRTAQLQAANKELEAFSYSVSHDLRSPLRGIDGWSLALQEDYGAQLDATATEYLNRVRSETQRMSRLIDDMLSFSRLGRTDLHRRDVDLSDIAETVAARIRSAASDRQFDFQIQPGVTANGDPHLLEAVLTNLFENAAKFSSSRPVAKIEFSCSVQPDPETHRQRAVYVVRDNGVGFDMAYSQNLFGVFQRLHKPSEYPGTGIGLATVQRIVQRHGGRIWADARLNEGAAFFFTLD